MYTFMILFVFNIFFIAFSHVTTKSYVGNLKNRSIKLWLGYVFYNGWPLCFSYEYSPAFCYFFLLTCFPDISRITEPWRTLLPFRKIMRTLALSFFTSKLSCFYVFYRTLVKSIGMLKTTVYCQIFSEYRYFPFC